MTTTVRRTAKVATHSSRGYVAIHCDYIAKDTEMLRCTANKDMEIKGVQGASVEIKAGQEFYLVRAGSLSEDMFYIVLVGLTGVKKCSCAANKPCKHEIAVQAREELRSQDELRQTQQAQQSEARREVVAPMAVAASSFSQSDKVIAAPLNSNSGFSLFR